MYHCYFPLSKVSFNLLNKLCDLHTYINGEVLTYVITLPVAGGETFELIAMSVSLENKEFLYIATEESIFCLDQIGLLFC